MIGRPNHATITFDEQFSFIIVMSKSNQGKLQRLEYSRMTLIPPISSIDLMALKSKMVSLLIFQNTMDIH
jgi:hypothetical protein